MPTLNVTDVLDDPDFNQVIDAVNRNKIVSTTTGRTTTTDTPLVFISGVIQPTKKETLEQYPELDRSKQHITIWTKSIFKVGITVITWHDTQFVVRLIDNWEDYGEGYTMCMAERLELEVA